MKIIEINAKVTKINKIFRNLLDNYKNHKNIRNPFDNHENRENIKIRAQ